jgi:ABC-type transport system involved in multi-copper enzyme maturation permease subunit
VIWLTWRQHRAPGAVAALAVAALCGGLIYIALRAQLIAGALGIPLQSDAVRTQLQLELGGSYLVPLLAVGVLFLPSFIGIFAGVPLVSRELEDGTHRLIWTQGISREFWFLSKVGLLVAALVLAAALISFSAMAGAVALPAVASFSGRFASFDTELPVLLAWTLLAFGVGVAFGALVKRALPAVLAAMLAYAAVRIYVTAALRSGYLPPLQAPDERQLPAEAWQLPHRFVDAAGREVDPARISQLIRDFGSHAQEFQGNMARYLEQNGVFQPVFYQPADRYWVFQTIESAFLIVAAIVCLGIALFLVRRVRA